ncbi:hypothetical protein F2Q69_00047920 [Brassica cretica]|uniref:Uncharacterized protein n=1 Tax=Brassica cretica TaxID=69181 RepID=A0A8S9PL90_BRACR|nr:hypothetical protein F2Q69_00047920 [Brassica cretica]
MSTSYNVPDAIATMKVHPLMTRRLPGRPKRARYLSTVEKKLHILDVRRQLLGLASAARLGNVFPMNWPGILVVVEKSWRRLRRRWICEKEKEETESKFVSGTSSREKYL